MTGAAGRPAARPGPHPWQWFARLPRAAQMAIAALLGALAGLGQEPYGYGLVLLLSLVMAFLMFRRQKTAAGAALTGWAYGCGYFGLALVWIVQPFQIDPDRHAWMAPFALVLLAAGLALFWGLAFWAARRLSPRTWPLILTWTAAEMLRAYVFTGFPWANLPQALAGSLAGQGLALAGPHGMMLWMAAAAWALSFPAVRRGRAVMRAGQLLLLAACTAAILLPPPGEPSPLTPHAVRIVQPNAAQDLKWRRDMVQMFFGRQLDFTAAPPAEGGPVPDLVIWPETAIPWLLEDAQPALDQIAVAAAGRPVVLGLNRREGRSFFNALVAIDAAGQVTQTYDKHHVVPFGEYVPFGDLLGRFGINGMATRDGNGFSAGPGARLLDLGPLGTALPLICYEAVFAHDVNAAPERPAFLLQITNDAWFGLDAGPQQHLAQARMRAIEQGLPMVRSANTGISAMIDPRGRVIAQLGLGQAGFVDAPLPAPLPPTPYSRTGDAPAALLLLAGLLAAAWRGRRSGGRFSN